MSKLKGCMLLGACFATVIGGTSAANAAVTVISGAGSSLLAPYARQAEDCYGNKEFLIIKGTTPTLVSVTPFVYTGSPALNCNTQHANKNANFFFDSTGSGTGINALYGNDPSLAGDTNPNKTGNQFLQGIQYGFSDTSLDVTDVGIYDNGGGPCVAPATCHVGVSVQAPGGGSGTYANPKVKFGAMVQFPMSIDPVAIAYDPVYKKVVSGAGEETDYHFNVQAPRADGSGGLHLDAKGYCKIFNGQIKNWNDPVMTQLNGGVSLEDPSDPTPANKWSVPMQITGRFDSSGTSSIFTRHLAAVCGVIQNNHYADATTTLPPALHVNNAHYDKTQPNNNPPAGEALGQFTLADGSDGVAKYVNFSNVPANGSTLIQGRIGYVGTDYALPGALNNPADPDVGGYALNTATLKNASGHFIAPTALTAKVSFGSVLPPQTNANGTFNPSTTGKLRSNPQDWVEPASKTSPLANPAAAQGYPIVGTTNFIGYSCYSTAAKASTITDFIKWYSTTAAVYDANIGILSKAGLSPLPSVWRGAIKQAFVLGSDGQNLTFGVAGTGSCANATTGG
ncbi:MAG TPA: substrate-binding domain-containing protein [Rhizomicrobium sp.]